MPLILLAPLAAAEVRPVASLDLERYAGKWYEIARLPNRFQRGCASDTTATYTLRPDRKITVLNQCRTGEGKMKSARGTARMASATGPTSQLKVSFFWPFSGDYWVIGLDPDYRWALIGEPGRKYLWILSREPKMDEALYQRILGLARDQGYDVSSIIREPQSAD
ncbi:MAG: lipocalin family protein [Candidatus Omnitrophica bacterium]|nr:lipocalin family protein [Candidatus Omnitrophota bacterium]